MEIFGSARTSCTTSGEPVSLPARKKTGHLYTQVYMPHESSGDSSNQPDGPMGSPRCPFDPLGPPPPPLSPLGTPNWSLGLIEL